MKMDFNVDILNFEKWYKLLKYNIKKFLAPKCIRSTLRFNGRNDASCINVEG